MQQYIANKGESIYFEASDHHLLENNSEEKSEVIYVVTILFIRKAEASLSALG